MGKKKRRIILVEHIGYQTNTFKIIEMQNTLFFNIGEGVTRTQLELAMLRNIDVVIK